MSRHEGCWAKRWFRVGMLLVVAIVGGCEKPDVRREAPWRMEIADLPMVWRQAPSSSSPSGVWAWFVKNPTTILESWTGRPRASGAEMAVFVSRVPNGARIRGTLSYEGVGPANVVVRLLGKASNEFWHLHTWYASEPGQTEFAATAPAGGEWVGGVVTVTGDSLTVVEVSSLEIEWDRPVPSRPHLVLVTLDTFRADHVSGVDSLAPPTPNLDSLAVEGTMFVRAMATSQCTSPSHASMLTGLYCFAHKMYRNDAALSSKATTLAEVLSSAGYRTAAAVSIAHLNHSSSNLGQGFETFIESRWPHPGGEPADVQTMRVLRMLHVAPRDSTPWFLWVHYFDPHTPYTPPPSFVSPSPLVRPGTRVGYKSGMGLVAYDENIGQVLDPAGEAARYRGEVAFLDSQLRFLFDGLRRLGLTSPGIVAVVADHGEGLGEHGIFFQHAGMFEQVLRVPLIVSGDGFPRGARVSTLVSGVDIFPTFLAAAGVRKSPPHYGVDLARLARGARSPRPFIFAESARGVIRATWSRQAKLVWVPEGVPQDWSVPEPVMLFNLGDDPEESRNLVATSPKEARRLRRAFEKACRRPVVKLPPEEGETDQARLKALGYVQ